MHDRPDPDYGGRCILKHVGQTLYIERADPRTIISAEVLDEIRAGNHHPAITLDGDLLKIRAVNRTVIYRIGEPCPTRFGYTAEWPD